MRPSFIIVRCIAAGLYRQHPRRPAGMWCICMHACVDVCTHLAQVRRAPYSAFAQSAEVLRRCFRRATCGPLCYAFSRPCFDMTLLSAISSWRSFHISELCPTAGISYCSGRRTRASARISRRRSNSHASSSTPDLLESAPLTGNPWARRSEAASEAYFWVTSKFLRMEMEKFGACGA